MKTISICIPLSWNYVPREFFMGFLGAFVKTKGIVDVNINRMPDLATCRNQLVKDTLKHNPDYILFLDADIILEMDTIDKLRSHGKDIVCALAYRKDLNPAIFRKAETGYLPIKDFNGLTECDAVGMACTLIKTEVFKKIPEPWFAFIQGERPLGEDFYLCEKAKHAGFSIYCDTNSSVGHIGQVVLKGGKANLSIF